MTHPHIKPFNLEHAKAGAPVGTLNHTVTVEILKYGEHKIFGILTSNIDESAEYWQLDGAYGMGGAGSNTLQLVMLPLGYCEGKPVFVGDMLMSYSDGQPYKALTTWKEMDGSIWYWPKAEPKYPETRMSDGELLAAIGASKSNCDMCRSVANAAIAHAIQEEDVFTKSQVTAVIEQLRNICDRNTSVYAIRNVVDGTDWDSILQGAM